MLGILTATTLLLGAASPVEDSRTAVRFVQPDRPIAAGGPGLPLVEPHVAVNPADPAHLVVAAIAAAPVRTGPWHCAAFASFDGGATWTRQELRTGRFIDP